MSAVANFVPALRYRWLTRWYDALMAGVFPETRVRLALIKSADIHLGQRILDFGVGTASLSILLKKIHVDTVFGTMRIYSAVSPAQIDED